MKAQALPQGQSSGLGVHADGPGEAHTLASHPHKTLRAFVHNEAELPPPRHGLRLEVPADERAAVVLQGLGHMHGREVHEGFPRNHGGAAGEDHVERHPLQLPPGVRFGIEREGTHAVNDILEVRRDREVPDGAYDQKTLCVFHLLLQVTEVIGGTAGRIVVCEGEVFDGEILQPHLFHGRALHRAHSLHEGVREHRAVARFVGARDEDEDVHAGIVANFDYSSP